MLIIELIVANRGWIFKFPSEVSSFLHFKLFHVHLPNYTYMYIEACNSPFYSSRLHLLYAIILHERNEHVNATEKTKSTIFRTWKCTNVHLNPTQIHNMANCIHLMGWKLVDDQVAWKKKLMNWMKLLGAWRIEIAIGG